MTYVDNIVDAFGGVRPMARRLGKSSSTVGSWKDRGTIPDSEKPAVLAAAVEDGLPLTRVDFFPVCAVSDPVSPVHDQPERGAA